MWMGSSVYSVWPFGLFSGRGAGGALQNRTIGMQTFAHGVDSHMNFAWGYVSDKECLLQPATAEDGASRDLTVAI